MGLKINISPQTELNQPTEVSQSNPSAQPLQSNTDAQNEEAIQFLNNRTSANRITTSRDDETRKELTTADFLREVLKRQPVAVNDENAAKVQLTMKVSKSPQATTRDDYNLAFRRAVYEKAMDGLKLTDEEIKLADEALINAGLYKTYYNLQGNIENLKTNQEKSGSSMPISVGKENIEYARRAGQAVLQFREYQSLTADAKAEYARRYATDALGGFVQVPINGGVNIVNGLSEPFRAGERMMFGTNYIPEVPRMTVAEQSEYWNKDGRMAANRIGEIGATIAFGGVTGSRMLATQTGRALLGIESTYNIGAGIAGTDITQTDENGNARQMEWSERSLRIAGGLFGARQTIKTEVATPNSAVNKLSDIFKDPPTFKPQAEFITNEGITVKINENTFDKPLQSADDLNSKIVTVDSNGNPSATRFRNDYEDHIKNRDFSKASQKSGVNGAHNLREFEQYDITVNPNLTKESIKIVSKIPHPLIKGIYKTEYQMPLLDKTGKPSGLWRNKSGNQLFEKTVYDPSIISDSQMAQWGREAFADAVQKGSVDVTNRFWTGISSNGVKISGYLETKDNSVRTFFIDF